ncbi:MAG: GIY-YIG nuclease family protein [Hyphomonadaceae bacterium]
MEDAGGWVYILASGRNGTLYTGSARVLSDRIYQHREGLIHGFTRKYGVTRLVWFEAHDCVAAAYKREQLIKRWRRAWKLALIEKLNPQWLDLYPSIAGFGPPLDHVLRSSASPPHAPRKRGQERGPRAGHAPLDDC